ncbi:uncharacterized protein LOC114814604 [Ornithorhynchus anatinus]|uniref:uncharacterized protein LOC114814604 n=1 Tax=Ornithorhynchus anatinus TaxID=9258 RepID=UPI0019D45DF8|nr:uncharacterized protein LOC114814604 [Ornithorhynchus anatinus]
MSVSLPLTFPTSSFTSPSPPPAPPHLLPPCRPIVPDALLAGPAGEFLFWGQGGEGGDNQARGESDLSRFLPKMALGGERGGRWGFGGSSEWEEPGETEVIGKVEGRFGGGDECQENPSLCFPFPLVLSPLSHSASLVPCRLALTPASLLPGLPCSLKHPHLPSISLGEGGVSALPKGRGRGISPPHLRPPFLSISLEMGLSSPKGRRMGFFPHLPSPFPSISLRRGQLLPRARGGESSPTSLPLPPPSLWGGVSGWGGSGSCGGSGRLPEVRTAGGAGFSIGVGGSGGGEGVADKIPANGKGRLA